MTDELTRVVAGAAEATTKEDVSPSASEALIDVPEAVAERSDPFPREAWSTLISHAAGYLRLTLALLRDPAVSKHRRAALLAAAAYFASPIDLIPGIVPVLGQVDDLAVAILAIRLALNALEPGRRQMHLQAAGLSDETLQEDLRAIGRLVAWTARAGARTGLRVGRATLRFTARTGRAAAERLAIGGRAAAGRAGAVAGIATDRASAAAGFAGVTAGRAGETGRRLAARIRRHDAEAEVVEARPDGAQEGGAGTD